ncbi:Enoyl-CoA hydratase/isomerase [Desulfatibacillum aliphaticivorans]|uniref:Enoyl-CoA hydratase/isomerase n=1 Tax=Desulfatibacillum aliphaticivorans TaxID=218208 RepID=B8FED9_DESAL|nr:enoyl-CoA hydratase-related protein [Desulfatibacillum aliphaticivorans]ACL06920.1 Enoyl-CoA hydratase/isomerase [Desulfatibacillum aliphaticivorans]
MQTEDFKDILYDKGDDGVVTLTLNTPKRKNALSAYSFLELYWAMEHFDKDPEAGVMIITGAGNPDSNDPAKEAYSSGGYFSTDVLEGLPDEILQQIDLTDIAQKRFTMKMFNCCKPIIAAVNGLAMGGAFTMTLAGCDLVYMSEHAWVQMPFSKLGLVPELASTYFLPRLLGFQKAKEILYFSKKLTAADCLELGLANAVLPHDELLDYAREQARKLTPPGGAGLAIQEMKRILHKPHAHEVAQALDLENKGLNKLWSTEDFMEGVMSRIERRPPVYRGK